MSIWGKPLLIGAKYGNVTGSSVSFYDGNGEQFQELTTTINLIQSGTGDPSLTNIRPISLWQESNLSISGAGGTNIITTSWSSSPGYIAEGLINLLTGVLTVTKLGRLFDGTESWSQLGTAGTTRFFRNIDTRSTATTSNRGSSHYPNASITTSSQSVGYYAYTSGSRSDTFIQFRPVLADIATNTAWANFLAAQYANGTPVTCYYSPASTLTYQLTAQQIYTLVGLNTVSDTCGNVSVKYPKNYIVFIS